MVDPERKDQYPVIVKMEKSEKTQKELDFTPPRPRSFISVLPARIDEYEDGVAHFFHLKTGLDYLQAIEQVVDFVAGTGRTKVVDLLTDTAKFALGLAKRKGFSGRVYSFDSDITLLERAKLHANQLKVQQSIEFKQCFHESKLPLPDDFADAAVSIFDLHRHALKQYCLEIMRILEPNGLFVVAVLTEPNASVPLRFWRRVRLKYIHKNPTEADTVYPDREELIKSLLGAGFRQVIVQEINAPTTMRPGVFNIIAATK